MGRWVYHCEFEKQSNTFNSVDLERKYLWLTEGEQRNVWLRACREAREWMQIPSRWLGPSGVHQKKAKRGERLKNECQWGEEKSTYISHCGSQVQKRWGGQPEGVMQRRSALLHVKSLPITRQATLYPMCSCFFNQERAKSARPPLGPPLQHRLCLDQNCRFLY